jgi:hypothetical protein
MTLQASRTNCARVPGPCRSRQLQELAFLGPPVIRPGRPDRPRRLHWPKAPHRIEHEARPPMRSADGRGRPPQLFTDVASCGRRDGAHRCPGDSQAAATASLRALLRDTRQESTDLGLPVAAVAAECPDRRELPCLRPPGDCLRVNPEHCCDLCRSEQRLGLWCTCRHNDGLSSWTSPVIPYFFFFPVHGS